MRETACIESSLRAAPLTAEAFAPFGEVVLSPREAGERNLYTRWLGSSHAGMTPRLHVNRIAPSTLPAAFCALERHPHTAQIFLPLDVACYLIVVAASDPNGEPLYRNAQAFLAPGNLGIVYAPGTWHTGMVVLERHGSFSVLMWRNDGDSDEEFFSLPTPLRVEL